MEKLRFLKKFLPFCIALTLIIIVISINSKTVSLNATAERIAYSKIHLNGDNNLFLLESFDSNAISLTNFENTYKYYDPRFVVSDPVYSPDGCKIAFVLQKNYYDNKLGKRIDTYDIYVMDYNSSLMQLTYTGDNIDPAWTPDGRYLSFTSERDGDQEIYIMDINCLANWEECDANAFQVTHNEVDDAEVAWSPDGQYVVFISNRDSYQNMYLAKAEDFLSGKEESMLLHLNYTEVDISSTDGPPFFPGFCIRNFVWSPIDETQIAFTCSLVMKSRIGVIDISEAIEGKIDKSNPLVPKFIFNLDEYYAGQGLSWSPNGEQLIFTLDYKREVEREHTTGIYVVNIQEALKVENPFESMRVIQREGVWKSFNGVSWAPQICDADLD